jgi:hypothetical protein
MATASPDPLAHLPTVSLAELNQAAALQTRTDRKYVLHQENFQPLVDDLTRGVRVLEIDGVRRFGYESTYFDTPALNSYLDAARSRPNRFKVRIRTYLDSGSHHLEVKTRARDQQTVKTRRTTTAAGHDRLSPSDRAFVANTLRRELNPRPRAAQAGPADHARAAEDHQDDELTRALDGLKPVLRTHYRRSTLLIPARPTTASPSRATIDTSLVFTTPAGAVRLASDLVIIETKTPGPPSSIDRLLWEAGHRPVKVSKYGAGLALVFPHLPATKWNRVLRRDFGWRPSGSSRCRTHP